MVMKFIQATWLFVYVAEHMKLNTEEEEEYRKYIVTDTPFSLYVKQTSVTSETAVLYLMSFLRVCV